jgi:tetratricopeptide (TPR) repeat protein
MKLSIITFLLFSFNILIAQPEVVDYTDYKSGLLAKRQGEYEKAIQDFTTFLTDYPDYPRAYYYRGRTYGKLENYKAALADFEKLIELDSKDAEAYYAAGRMSYALGNLENAVDFYSKTIALEPFHAYAYNDRGMTNCYLENFGQAVSDFKRAVTIDSTFAMAYNNIGAAQYFNQDIELPSTYDMREARKWFTKAVNADNTLFIGYFNRAAMNYFLGDLKAAQFDIQKATALSPSEPMVHFYKGMVLRKQKNYGAAKSAYEQALELNPNLKFALEEIGNTYVDNEDYENALTYYERAKQLENNPKSMYSGFMDYRMSVAYAKQENEAAMLAALKTAKKADLFKDKKVYQEFLQEKAFKKFRNQKDFKKFAKSIQKIKKYNKFIGSELNWFRMSR